MFAMKFFQFVVAILPSHLKADRRLELKLDQHDFSVLFWPVLYLFEVRLLVADPNPKALVGRVILRHFTMLVNETRRRVSFNSKIKRQKITSSKQVKAQLRTPCSFLNSINWFNLIARFWKIFSLGSLPYNTGQWWSLPVEDHSARKTTNIT